MSSRSKSKGRNPWRVRFISNYEQKKLAKEWEKHKEEMEERKISTENIWPQVREIIKGLFAKPQKDWPLSNKQLKNMFDKAVIESDIPSEEARDFEAIDPKDIKSVLDAKKKFPNHVICGYDKVHKFEDPTSENLPKVVVNHQQELIYISRAVVPGKKNKNEKVKYLKQVCIYAFNKEQLKKYYFKKKKSETEKIEDIEILRFFDLNIKIKMVRLHSNSVAVDVITDIKKAEKILSNEKKVS